MFGHIEKIDLLKNIEKHLALCPEDSPDFLTAVSRGLESFKKAAKDQKSRLAYQAIADLHHFVCGKKKLDKMGTICLINAMFHNFPNGWDDVEHGTSNDMDVFKLFLKHYYCKLKHDEDWEKMRGIHQYMKDLKADERTIELLDGQKE